MMDFQFFCTKFTGPQRAARPGSGDKMEISSSVFLDLKLFQFNLKRHKIDAKIITK